MTVPGRMGSTIIAAALSLAIAHMASAADSGDLRAEAAAAFGVLTPVADAATRTPQALLGRALFWDARVSGDGKTACASCHRPADGGADGRRYSLDARGKETLRNSQTVFNAVLQPALRWTGDRTSAAHQAERSLTGSMGFATAEEVVPVLERLGYEAGFRAAFADATDPITPGHYASALAAYEATLIVPAAFDRFLSGDATALDARQQAGLTIFMRVGCADCHQGPLLGGRALKRFGVEKDYWTATGSERRDGGLYETTKQEADRSRFRVSMLRNVSRTAPYFHDGSVSTLTDAVQIMADVQLGHRMSDADAAAVVAFLEGLSGDVPANYAPPSPVPMEGKRE